MQIEFLVMMKGRNITPAGLFHDIHIALFLVSRGQQECGHSSRGVSAMSVTCLDD